MGNGKLDHHIISSRVSDDVGLGIFFGSLSLL